MKHVKAAILFFTLLVSFFLTQLSGLEDKQIQKNFKGVTTIQLNTISGDCFVTTAPEDEVNVRFVFPYSNTNFAPQFLQEGGVLTLKENFRISETGNATWYLSVPKKTAIKFISIAGDFSVIGINANVSGTTVSGDVVAKNCTGDLEFKSTNGDLEIEALTGNITVRGVSSDLKISNVKGNIQIKTESADVNGIKLEGNIVIKSPSGSIRLTDCAGNFDVKTASGDIKVTNTQFIKASFFKTASGSIDIALAKSLTENLDLESASGDVLLNYNGNPISGYFEFQVAADSGNIKAPYAFEKEEETSRWGKKYLTQSFKVELSQPRISIRTSSGTATLKQK